MGIKKCLAALKIPINLEKAVGSAQTPAHPSTLFETFKNAGAKVTQKQLPGTNRLLESQPLFLK
jgi:hypothetical protein